MDVKLNLTLCYKCAMNDSKKIAMFLYFHPYTRFFSVGYI